MSRPYKRLSPAPIPKVNAWSSNELLKLAANKDDGKSSANCDRIPLGHVQNADHNANVPLKHSKRLGKYNRKKPFRRPRKRSQQSPTHFVPESSEQAMTQLSMDYSCLHDSGYDSDIGSIVLISSSNTSTNTPADIPAGTTNERNANVVERNISHDNYSCSSTYSTSPPHSTEGVQLAPWYPALVVPVRLPDGTFKWVVKQSASSGGMPPMPYFPNAQHSLSAYVPFVPYQPFITQYSSLSNYAQFINNAARHRPEQEVDQSLPSNSKRISRSDTVKTQLQYYFSIENLCKDIYLRQQFNKVNGGIKIDTIMNFNKIKSLVGTDKTFLINTIKDKCSEFLELLNDDSEVRINNWKLWAIPTG